jgi:hypothetical protein
MGRTVMFNSSAVQCHPIWEVGNKNWGSASRARWSKPPFRDWLGGFRSAMEMHRDAAKSSAGVSAGRR